MLGECPAANLEYLARQDLKLGLSSALLGGNKAIPAGEHTGVSRCTYPGCARTVYAHVVFAGERHSGNNLNLPADQIDCDWSGECQRELDARRDQL